MNNIDRTLEKYFEGETSLEEEKELILYFQSDKIESKHEQYKAIFQFITIEKSTTVKEIRRHSNKANLYYFAAASASVIAAIFITINFSQSSKIESVVYVNGKKIVDIETIHNETLKAINSIEDDGDILESQIDLLDSFTQ